MPPKLASRRGPKPNLQTRDTLLKEGVRLLHQTGYNATGIQDIVTAAGVPKGSFYNHFTSKEVFASEAVDVYFESGLVQLRSLLTDQAIPPLDRLRHYFELRIQGYTDWAYQRGCLMGNLSLEVADHSDLVRERLARHFATWRDLLAQCIAEAQQSGAIRNPLPASQLADFLLNSWEGALLRMRAENSAVPLKTFEEIVFTTLLV